MSRLLSSLVLLACAPIPAWSAAPPGRSALDPLPAGARLRIGTQRFRHGGVIRTVAFSSDGKLLASAGHDHTLSIWDVQRQQERFRFRGHTGDVLCVAFSHDGHLVASGGADGTVRLWSVHGRTAGEELHTFTSKSDAVETLAFSPDGKVLAAGDDEGFLRLYDVNRRQLLRAMSQDRAVHCLAWSTDGRMIASNAAVGSVALWDAGTGLLLRTFGEEAINCLAFAPKGKQLVTWEEGGVLRLWSTATGHPVRTWGGGDVTTGPDALIYQIAFTPDGKNLLCGSAGGSVDVWDPASGKRRGQLFGHRGRVAALAVEPHGRLLASGGADGTLRLWDLTRNQPITKTVEPAAPVVSLSVEPGGKALTLVLASGAVQRWDSRSGKRLPLPLKGQASSAAFGLDGALYGVDADARLVRWDPTSGAPTLVDPEPGVVALVVSADRKSMATLHHDGALRLRDAKGGRRRLCTGGERRGMPVLAPAGQELLKVGASAAILAWDGKTGRPVTPYSGHRGGTLCAAFSPDGKTLASGGRDRTLRFWDVKTRREARPPLEHDAWICAVAFSPDSKLLATATIEGDVRVWSAHTGVLLDDLEGHRGPLRALTFLDGKTLVSAGTDTAVLVWDVSPGRVSRVSLTPAQRLRCWGQLIQEPVVASLAMQRLARDPAVVPLLDERLAPVDGKKIAALLDDLDADEFRTRAAAFTGLAAFGRFAEGAVRQALAKKPNLEKHRRLEDLLRRMQDNRISSEHQRALRSVEVLARIATPAARKTLQRLAAGASEAELTIKAKAALKSLP
jgi:WD40 repeat protein